MEQPLTIREGLVIPGYELWFTASRSGGPGGQHVNKTSSKVTLHWDLAHTTALTERQRATVMTRLRGRLSAEGVLRLSVEDSRSQYQNKETARERLAELVRGALVVAKRRIPTKTTAGGKRRRLQDKKRRTEAKKMRRPPSEHD